MKVYKADKLLQSDYFDFSYSRSALRNTELKHLNNVGGIAFYFEDQSSFELKSFLEDTFQRLLQEYKVYFILIDKHPSPKNRIRSRYKLLSKHLLGLGKKNIHEIEYDVKKNESVFLSLIKLTVGNLDYVTDNFLSNRLIFGYVVPKGKRSFISREKFLFEIASEFSLVNKNLETNLLKAASKLSRKDKFIFNTILDGKDNHSFELYLGSSQVSKILSKINKLTYEFSLN